MGELQLLYFSMYSSNLRAISFCCAACWAAVVVAIDDLKNDRADADEIDVEDTMMGFEVIYAPVTVTRQQYNHVN